MQTYEYPAGLNFPFSDMVIFSNRIRTTENFTLEMRRSSLDELNTNTDIAYRPRTITK